MLRDWGSRDRDFIALNARVRARLVELAGGAGSHVARAAPGQRHLRGRGDARHAACRRAASCWCWSTAPTASAWSRMARRHGRAVAALDDARRTSRTIPQALDRALAADPAISHVAAVQCETTSGILNPIESIAEVTARHGRRLLIDAMSAFGALPLDARRGAVRRRSPRRPTSASKGVPGRRLRDRPRRARSQAAAGNAPALSLDLHDQWTSMERTGQWRFTPPTHVLAALRPGARGARGRGRHRRAAARATARTAGSWSRACARSASRPCCRTACRRRSS